MARRQQRTELDEAVWAEWNRLCFGKDSSRPGRPPKREEYVAYIWRTIPDWDEVLAMEFDGRRWGLRPQ